MVAISKYLWYSLFSLPVILVIVSVTLLMSPNQRIPSIME